MEMFLKKNYFEDILSLKQSEVSDWSVKKIVLKKFGDENRVRISFLSEKF